ncbi:MAG TPA: glycerol-3-phosphate acyltransferase [Dehalococcoidia bacterium]|nr:glycerol-3-phosphate acyltransferase [Dehalococcoidia bacterium]
MPLGILSIIIGYLLGSIPTAYIMSRLRKGIDIRTVGNGNMGAANVMREIGIPEGIFVGLIDIAKGAGAILIAQTLNISELWVFGAGFAALVGHNFPVFAGFRGGRGTATVMGIFLVLAPQATLVPLVIVVIPFFATIRFPAAILIGFALGCLGFALLPLSVWLLEGSLALVFYVLAIDLFMLIRNLSGIKQVLSKGMIKDMLYDRQQKKAK